MLFLEAGLECRQNEFKCSDGACIDSSLRCNQYPDCYDRSDEDHCGSIEMSF